MPRLSFDSCSTRVITTVDGYAIKVARTIEDRACGVEPSGEGTKNPALPVSPNLQVTRK